MIRPEDFEAALRAKAKELAEQIVEVAIPAAAPALLGEYKERIFVDGLDSEGGKIGTYSTKPAYFSKEQFVKKGAFKGQGKTGEKKFATGAKKGQPHASMYLKSGYQELRGIQGRETGFKNLNYSNSLFTSVQVYKLDGKTVLAIADAKESTKRKAQEKQTGKTIFFISQREIDVFAPALMEEVRILKDRIFG